MKPTLAVPALLALAATDVTPRFGPAEGLRLQKTFEVTTTLDFRELTSVFNGADVPPEYLPEMDMHFETNRAVVVSDRYEAVADGKPKRLHRRYAEIEEFLEMSVLVTGIVDESTEYDGETELAGAEVVFEWDGDEATARFAEDEGDDALLEGLRADMDFCAFLPRGEKAVGGVWELDPELFRDLVHPGGDLAVEGLEDPEQPPRGEPTWSGAWKARITGEEDGLLRIALSGDVAERYEYATDLRNVPVADGSATEVQTQTWAVEGELVWSLAGGHVHAATLGGELVSTTVTKKDAGQPGPDFESTLVLAGEWSVDVTVEAAP